MAESDNPGPACGDVHVRRCRFCVKFGLSAIKDHGRCDFDTATLRHADSECEFPGALICDEY